MSADGGLRRVQLRGGGTACCAGDLKLDQLRVNQLRLCRQLSGSLEVGPGGVRLHARGLRPDEVRGHRPGSA